MRELPPWLDAEKNKDFVEKGSDLCQPQFPRYTTGASVAHPHVWKLVQSYVKTVSRKLLGKYGRCIASISPTLNNEYETRYTQTYGMMRDYSARSVAAYRDWQVDQGLAATAEEAAAPPDFPCTSVCMPNINEDMSRWLGFREEFLATKYVQLCQIAKGEESNEDGVPYRPDCLLHIGEMFSSADVLNSNLFFRLARSEYVDHLVMDSNMALFGAPSSPSIVGILVSAAQAYGKSVHYEAATERILPCDDGGRLVAQEAKGAADANAGVSLLFRSGVERALEASVHSLGVTNLCAPGELGRLLGQDPERGVADLRSSLQRASGFAPTAVIFVPYRAFQSYSFVITGVTCGLEHTECWHDSFANIPVFGHGKANQKPFMCNVDLAQQGLINVWDDLRTRHRQVVVIADPEKLTDELMSSATERVILKFPCVMTEGAWHFYEGRQIRTKYEETASRYPFSEILLDIPTGTCDGGAPKDPSESTANAVGASADRSQDPGIAGDLHAFNTERKRNTGETLRHGQAAKETPQGYLGMGRVAFAATIIAAALICVWMGHWRGRGVGGRTQDADKKSDARLSTDEPVFSIGLATPAAGMRSLKKRRYAAAGAGRVTARPSTLRDQKVIRVIKRQNC